MLARKMESIASGERRYTVFKIIWRKTARNEITCGVRESPTKGEAGYVLADVSFERLSRVLPRVA